MVDSIENVSKIIAIYTSLEATAVIGQSQIAAQLSDALLKLYRSSLSFLAHAKRYYEQNTLSMFHPNLFKVNPVAPGTCND